MRKLWAFLAVSVLLIVAVNVAAAGAQATPVVDAACTDGTLTVTWSGGDNSAATITVTRLGERPVTQRIVAGNAAGTFDFTVPLDASGQVSMQFGAAPAATADFSCVVSEGAALQDQTTQIVAALGRIEREVQDVEADVVLATAAVWQVDTTLRGVEGAVQDAENATRLLKAVTERMEQADLRRQAQLAQVIQASYDTARTTETKLAQARHQTHALLALVAILFAMWLRPVLRSRREVS